MIPALLGITFRALLSRRRTLLLALVGGLLVLITVVYGLGNPPEAESGRVMQRLLGDFGLGVLLPLVAVIVGTAAVGSELDDGTIVYLLAKPIERRWIILVKLVVAWLVVVILVAPAIAVSALIGQGDTTMAVGYAAAATFGALEYTAVFLALSLVTSRALVIGLAYVVVWEGVVAGLFAGTRVLSVRQHAMAVADALGGNAAPSAQVDPAVAVPVGLAITLLATVLAIRRLERVELRGETA
ncbi:MAG: ABC transporter permease [Candidatus Limnocylindria bacterium]